MMQRTVSSSSKALGRLAFYFVCLVVLHMIFCVYLVSIAQNSTRQALADDSDDIIPAQNCSCTSPVPVLTDDDEDDPCCSRILFRGHKFGTILQLDLFREFIFEDRDDNLWFHGMDYLRYQNEELPTNFRHVAVTRNWFDSIVSAYLYHKAGYECWITYRGVENRSMTEMWPEWYSRLNFHRNYQLPFPDPKNRSICTYLREESVEDGMRALIDFSLSRWYKGVISYWRKVQKRLHQDRGIERVLWLCYEDLSDPHQQEALFHRVIEWMFPTQDTRNVSMPQNMKESLLQQQANNTIYSGAHASTHDPMLQKTLRALVKQLDEDYFNNTLALSNKIFECGPTDE